MLEVFICEDDKIQREKLRTSVEKYISIEDLDMKIGISTANPDEVINHVKSLKKPGIYFFDIDLKSDYNGISLAAEIRKYDSLGAMIFITTHPELICLTFTHKVAALDFIVKTGFEQMENRIRECIKVAYNRLNSNLENNKVFKVNTGDKSIFVKYDDILFFEFESATRKIILYTKTSRIKFQGKLKDIEKLDDQFCRCHNSFVVNKTNIAELDKLEFKIHMINGEICEVSRRGVKALLQEPYSEKHG